VPPAPLPCSYRNEFDEASKYNEQLAANLGKVVDDLHPVRVLQLFSAIPHEVGLVLRALVAPPVFGCCQCMLTACMVGVCCMLLAS